jgi:hypothetical protein
MGRRSTPIMRTFIKLVLLLSIGGVIIICPVANYVRSHQTASLHSCYFNQMWYHEWGGVDLNDESFRQHYGM